MLKFQDYGNKKASLKKEAFLLELNLIRKYLPKYNILLKDDKHYPYIELTKGEYPYLRIARKINKKEGKLLKKSGMLLQAFL